MDKPLKTNNIFHRFSMDFSRSNPGWFYRKTGELQDILSKREAEIYKLGKEQPSHSGSQNAVTRMDKESLQQYWQKIVQDHHRQEERNEMLLRKLGKVEEHMALLSSKTAALSSLREQYASMMKILSTMNAESAPWPTQSHNPMPSYTEYPSQNFHQQCTTTSPQHLNSSSHFVDDGSAKKPKPTILVRNVSAQTEETQPLVCPRCGSFTTLIRSDSQPAVQDQAFRRVQSVSDLLGMSGLPKPPTPYPRMSAYSSVSSLNSQYAYASSTSEVGKRYTELPTNRNYSFESLNLLSPIHSPESVQPSDPFESHRTTVKEAASVLTSGTVDIVAGNLPQVSNLNGYYDVHSLLPSEKQSPRKVLPNELHTRDKMQDNLMKTVVDSPLILNDTNLSNTVDKFVAVTTTGDLSHFQNNSDSIKTQSSSNTRNESHKTTEFTEGRHELAPQNETFRINNGEQSSLLGKNSYVMGDTTVQKPENTPSDVRDQESNESFHSALSRPPSTVETATAVEETHGHVSTEKSLKVGKSQNSARKNEEMPGNLPEQTAKHSSNSEMKNSPKHLAAESDLQVRNSTTVTNSLRHQDPLANKLETSDSIPKENAAISKTVEEHVQISSDDEDKESSVRAYQSLLGNVTAKVKTRTAVENSSESSDDIENAFFTSVMTDVSSTVGEKENHAHMRTSPRKEHTEVNKNNNNKAKKVTAEDRQRIAKKVMHLGSSSDSDVPVNLPATKHDSDSDDFFS